MLSQSIQVSIKILGKKKNISQKQELCITLQMQSTNIQIRQRSIWITFTEYVKTLISVNLVCMYSIEVNPK